jgi:hypothetical protein
MATNNFKNFKKIKNNMGKSIKPCPIDKPVHVRDYWRYRYGRWEHVREHCRRMPQSRRH